MLSRFFIHRPIFASVISILILVIGSVSMLALPIEQTPNITPPTVKVSAVYPGASAEVIAETVGFPIEKEVNGVDNMIYMLSKSNSDGTYELVVSFEVGTDIDMATVLVQNRVAIAEPKLPEEVKRQGVTTKKQSTSMVLMVNLIGTNEKYDELFQSNYINTQIVDPIKRVRGVGDVMVMGAQDFSMRIWMNPDRLKVRGLTTDDVIQAIRDQNVQVAAGQIGAPPNPKEVEFQYTINTKGRLKTPGEFENLIVKVGADGSLLRLKDVARVELGAESYKWSVDLNGKASIGIVVYQLPGANALDIADGIRSTMADLSKSFPEGLDYKIAYDSTRFITASIEEVKVTLFIAVLLVVLTVYVFLQDFRTTLIPAATIPVSLIGTFAVMLGLGITINTLSLFGIVLAIGIVVDDAIIVVENTMRIIDEEKLPAKRAAEKAMLEITGPVIATTIVLLAVFIPTAMVSGITGRLYQQFALTISVATVFSSINALTLSPALAGLLLRPTPEKKAWFFRAFENLLGRTRTGYTGIVAFLGRRLLISAVLVAGFFAATAFGFKMLPTGFIPNEDQGYVFLAAMLPEGAALGRTQAAMADMEKKIEDIDGIADIIRVSGYSFLDQAVSTNAGSMIVVLEPWSQRSTVQKSVRSILGQMQVRLAGEQRAAPIVFPPPPIQGLGAAGGFVFQLQDRGGAGLQLLEQVADDIVYAGTQDPVLTRMNNNFRTNVPQLYLDVDRTRIKRYGIPLTTVFQTLQAQLGSAYVNDFNIFGRTFKVMAQADHEFRNKVEDILRLEVRAPSGKMVPLRSLMQVKQVAGPRSIYRYNNYPSAQITGQPAPGMSSGQAIAEMDRIATEKMPSSMGYEWSGVTYQQLKAGSSTVFIFALALVFVMLVLAAQYESWSTPLAVLLTVPFALLGALALTFARMMDNNVYTQIGFVMLIGLSAKSAILIVEFAKQRLEEGVPLFDAAVEAARLRFRAILMTAFSFILGVVPLLVASGAGAASRRSLGTAVFGGMLAASVIGILFIPVLYIIVVRIFGGKRAATKPETGPAEDEGGDEPDEPIPEPAPAS